MNNVVVEHIGELVTLAPLAKSKAFGVPTEKNIERLQNAWLAIQNGVVHAYGVGNKPSEYKDWHAVNAGGGLVTPGFVDSHTHPIFAGSRVHEFAMRLSGLTYQDIADRGGGIQSTVQATRAAPDMELLLKLDAHLHGFLFHGVTTAELKTGYGLSLDHEIRLLRLLQHAKTMTKQHLYITCLALHAVPREYNSAQLYADDCAGTLLDTIANENLADAVDAFIENGYFSAKDCEKFFARAKGLGLHIRIHADEFSHSEGAETAVKFEARSADHLQFASSEAIAGMAKRNIVATLLPGTSLFTGIPFTDARPFAQAGCAIAIATDFNPGSCMIDNISLVASLAAVHCKMSLPQVIAGVTIVPAHSLNLGHRKGSLAVGYDGDFSIFGHRSLEDWIADFGKTLPDRVFIAGEEFGI